MKQVVAHIRRTQIVLDDCKHYVGGELFCDIELDLCDRACFEEKSPKPSKESFFKRLKRLI